MHQTLCALKKSVETGDKKGDSLIPLILFGYAIASNNEMNCSQQLMKSSLLAQRSGSEG
jgi:hypothetical protein